MKMKIKMKMRRSESQEKVWGKLTINEVLDLINLDDNGFYDPTSVSTSECVKTHQAEMIALMNETNAIRSTGSFDDAIEALSNNRRFFLRSSATGETVEFHFSEHQIEFEWVDEADAENISHFLQELNLQLYDCKDQPVNFPTKSRRWWQWRN